MNYLLINVVESPRGFTLVKSDAKPLLMMNIYLECGRIDKRRLRMISSDKWYLKKYCSEPLENIENYQEAMNDKEHMWECHHRAEILPCGVYSCEELKKVGMYWKRPASELIFIRHDEHRRLHSQNMRGETHTKLSQSLMGHDVSHETRNRISSSQLNRRDCSRSVKITRVSDGFTQSFPSQSEAARWMSLQGVRAHPAVISRCAHGFIPLVYG